MMEKEKRFDVYSNFTDYYTTYTQLFGDDKTTALLLRRYTLYNYTLLLFIIIVIVQ